ncbi:Hypothetical Protein FCC1311_075312 [Hondaea fermentalgiana]|uniref:N-acetyltransferase domain-containing protein n=1 Tax=Hondaea fermentalgiana TaxID=2315210 RepID=A0A2R5GNJ0_9STRA|nr:Hypothetical Protein FCC1311_075312 [Hondaea fermentalgiana]|eukprot:GBG31308.1 Hypothetical Protein FCC1311_075312 [Hondaea fermentalgiana]
MMSQTASRAAAPGLALAVAGVGVLVALRSKAAARAASSRTLATKTSGDGLVVDAKGVRHAPSSLDHIREATTNALELKILSELVNVAFYEGDGFIWSQGQRFRVGTDGADVRKMVEGTESTVLVYEDPVNKQLQGCVRIDWDQKKDVGHFAMVSVPLMYGGRGIGSLLVQAAQLHLKKQLSPAGEIVMDVISIRDDLLGFYSRRGFKRIGPAPLPDELKERACPEFRHVCFELMKKKVADV